MRGVRKDEEIRFPPDDEETDTTSALCPWKGLAINSPLDALQTHKVLLSEPEMMRSPSGE